MSIRVSESWTARNGHRRSVSMGLGTYALASLAVCFTRGLLGLFLLPFVVMWWMLMAELWILAALVLFIVTGCLAIAAVAHREARAADITVTRGRWGLFLVGLKGARQ